MTATTAKTAISVIAALMMSAGAAVAEDAKLVENINAEMDAQLEQTNVLVTANAELRVAELSERFNQDEEGIVTSDSFNGS